MKIFRIDGNKVYQGPEKGLKYFATNELAEEYLEKKGFYKETREFKSFKTPTIPVWYNKRLSEDGCAYDNTNYRKIVEVDVEGGCEGAIFDAKKINDCFMDWFEVINPEKTITSKPSQISAQLILRDYGIVFDSADRFEKEFKCGGEKIETTEDNMGKFVFTLIGMRARVTNYSTCHGFDIGEEVTILNYDVQFRSWECKSDNGVVWFLDLNEFELIPTT